MKKGKLTDTEKSCIQGMVAGKISIEDMAQQLDRSVTVIEKEVEKIKSQSAREQLYINKTAAGTKGVTIMTEAASTRGDIAKETTTSEPKQTKRSPWIHKIHE